MPEQEIMNHTEQTGLSIESALSASALSSVLAAVVGLRASVASGISVATQLPADGAG
jgi:uncharacterized membrane protein